ncbi:MAG: T9SS type A sorting domain-containing protein, partial [Elusimicrobiota bacterium]
PLETKLDTGNRLVTATLNHFSDFQLIVKAAVSDLKSMRVYPNPFYTNRGNGYVTIDPVPANSKIRIYTLSGEKVWEGAAGTTGVIIWKGVNKSGEQVASGIYLAVIDSASGKKVTKIAVER